VTVPVGEIDPAARRLLETTERALWAGREQARVGNRLSDISHAVGQVAHAAGYGILADHGGHGVGQLLHEDPSVDTAGRPGRGPGAPARGPGPGDRPPRGGVPGQIIRGGISRLSSER